MSSERDQLSLRLSEHGLRTTKARLLILSHVAQRKDHPTADTILKSLQKEGHPLGSATLYQNLGKLADVGLLLRITGVDGLMHFDANVTAHPHLTCISCGMIVDADVKKSLLRKLCPLDPYTGNEMSNWKLQEVQLELRGLCPKCK